MIDDRTTNLNLPLPNIANALSDDVGRLRTALTGLDARAPLQQLTLESGVSIKTVGGVSLLGSGDVPFPLSESEFPLVLVATTTKTAIAGNHYVLTNMAATTVTLPVAPSDGDSVSITVANGLATNVVARNGKTIMGLAENLTLNISTASVSLRYANASWRIV